MRIRPTRPGTDGLCGRHRRRFRRATAIGVLVVASAVLAGACAVGPDTGPHLITNDHNKGEAPPASAAALPALPTPAHDLDWRTCPQASVAAGDLPAPPSDVVIDCATMMSPVEPGSSSNRDVIRNAVMRVRLKSTPAAAAPLVLTSGTDLPSSTAALLLADNEGRSILASNPIVAIDRRGTGQSDAISCFTALGRDDVAGNGFDKDPNAAKDSAQRQKRLAKAAAIGADGCTETLSPYQLSFTSTNAAADIDVLRQQWNIDRIGIIGIGSGSDVALAYSGKYRSHLARLILDTPAPYDASAADHARIVADGTNAAITTFATECSAGSCPLGTNARQTLSTIIATAARGGIPGLADTDILRTLETSLALSTSDRSSTITRAAALIASAHSSAPPALTAAATKAAAVRVTDGQLLSRCNDTSSPVGQNDVEKAIPTWQRQYPFTGASAALALLRCNSWPAGPAAPTPQGFDVPILILTNPFDTITGGAGAAALGPLLGTTRAQSATITSNRPGYGALARSTCVADVVAQYVRSGTPGRTGACPT